MLLYGQRSLMMSVLIAPRAVVGGEREQEDR